MVERWCGSVERWLVALVLVLVREARLVDVMGGG